MSVRLARYVGRKTLGTEGLPFPHNGNVTVPTVPKIVPSTTWGNGERSHNVPITFPAPPSPFPVPPPLYRGAGTKEHGNVPRERNDEHDSTNERTINS